MVYLSEVKCLHRSRMIASAAAREGIRHKETSMNTRDTGSLQLPWTCSVSEKRKPDFRLLISWLFSEYNCLHMRWRLKSAPPLHFRQCKASSLFRSVKKRKKDKMVEQGFGGRGVSQEASSLSVGIEVRGSQYSMGGRKVMISLCCDSTITEIITS